jgi:hypothetical protein
MPVVAAILTAILPIVAGAVWNRFTKTQFYLLNAPAHYTSADHEV